MSLTQAQRLKFRLFADGLTITRTARDTLEAAHRSSRLSSADFASTSGLILELDDHVWVNAPIVDHNPNFVKRSDYVLDRDSAGLFVSGAGLFSRARSWIPPAYHSQTTADGLPLTNICVTHGDRARLSPIHGCGMACTFCDVPYGVRYGLKAISSMVEAVGAAVRDPVQPARHLLISGGTPKKADIPWLKDVYRSILTEFPDVPVDIMMVPVDDLVDVDELARLGVNQLSINLELFSDEAARRYMPQKARLGEESYLDFIERATQRLGPGRVRSMLMVGLEPMDATLQGVGEIARRGGVPVLSPFRPDPSTPLRDHPPPTAEYLEKVFLEATEILGSLGATLGPSCLPCSHNTLTLHDLASRHAYAAPGAMPHLSH